MKTPRWQEEAKIIDNRKDNILRDQVAPIIKNMYSYRRIMEGLMDVSSENQMELVREYQKQHNNGDIDSERINVMSAMILNFFKFMTK